MSSEFNEEALFCQGKRNQTLISVGIEFVYTSHFNRDQLLGEILNLFLNFCNNYKYIQKHLDLLSLPSIIIKFFSSLNEWTALIFLSQSGSIELTSISSNSVSFNFSIWLNFKP